MIETRAMAEADVPACTAIINHAIALGGTTAHEEAFTVEGFAQYYWRDPVLANVALSEGRVVGFQAVFDAGEGLYSIGSFTDGRNPVRGAGRALFRKTLADCRGRGGVAILAQITADNASGLGYYAAMGFEDWTVVPADHRRPDGRLVDRIVKRYPL